MEILTVRDPTAGDSTAGYVAVDGAFECHSLEDPVREPAEGRPPAWDADSLERWVLSWKVPGKTAIPSGRYRVTIEESPRFKRRMISIHGVPGFVGIRAHGGNKPDDTEGCPLLGDELDMTPAGWRIRGGQSKPAVDRLFDKVEAALRRGEEVWWTFRNTSA